MIFVAENCFVTGDLFLPITSRSFLVCVYEYWRGGENAFHDDEVCASQTYGDIDGQEVFP